MYKTHAKIKWSISCCPLLHLRGSIKEGSTVKPLAMRRSGWVTLLMTGSNKMALETDCFDTYVHTLNKDLQNSYEDRGPCCGLNTHR